LTNRLNKYCYEAICHEDQCEENKGHRKGKSKVHLLIDDQQVEQLSQFKYLGSWISDDGYTVLLRTYEQEL